MNYPEFIQDRDFMKMDSSVSETEQLKAMLDNLTRVHLLTASKFHSFDSLIRAYLTAGTEIFGMETGIVSHVDDNHIYHVKDVISPLDVLEKGQEFPIQDTYCFEVVKTEKVLGFPQVGELDYMNCHPVYLNLKLEAYLSAPIYVDDKLYGTLNFTSIAPRKNGFSVHEHNMILLMANAIGNYILLRSKERRLLELNDKMKRFVGYVSHDLRNPIGSIIGLAMLMERKMDDPKKAAMMLPKITSTAQDALELVNKILDMTALSTGKLVLESINLLLSDLYLAAKTAITDFANESDIQITENIDSNISVICDAKRIQQVLVNLLINAIKYSPAGGKVTISSELGKDVCHVVVSNTIADSHKINPSTEGIYDSIGFGLEIVETILQAHKSELKITKTQDYYSASFSLQTHYA